jgi:hypothetical protein
MRAAPTAPMPSLDMNSNPLIKRAHVRPFSRRKRVAVGSLLVAVSALLAPDLLAQSDVVMWGTNVGRASLQREAFVEYSLGGWFTAGRRADGTIATWGSNFYGESEAPRIPGGRACVALGTGSGWISEEEALSSALVTDAAYESMRGGRWVDVKAPRIAAFKRPASDVEGSERPRLIAGGGR